MYKLILTWICFLAVSAANAKEVTGVVQDATTRESLMGATVGMINSADSTKKYYNTTDTDGRFVLKGVPKGTYRLVITYVGYSMFSKNYTVNNQDLNVGVIPMKESSIALKEARVEGRAIRATQTGDTVSYNADAFKTVQGSSAEDMLRKMPGVVVQGGSVQAQGEQVKKVLVDGKEFFEGDPTTALRNLPTEVIQSIEIFDRQSDQSLFSGFNDGNTTKTINVVTRNRKVEGMFGKFSGGYGTDGYYMGSASYNYFSGDQRISLLGMSNNINQQNFSQDDLMGMTSGASRGMGGGRMVMRGGPGGGFGGGGFGVGQLNGVTQTHAGGINYSNNWNNKLTLSGSYFITYGDNTANQTVNREYFEQTETGIRRYNELSGSNGINVNHRFNARLEWNIDSANAILFYPQFNIQNSTSDYHLAGLTYFTTNGRDTAKVNGTVNNTHSTGNAFNGGGMLMYRHKFSKPGRTISIGANGRLTPNTSESLQSAVNTDYTLIPPLDTAYTQRIPVSGPGWSGGGMATYTEPLSKLSQLMFSYNFNYTYTDNDKKAYNVYYDPYSETLVPGLSSTYTSKYLTHNASLGYRLNGKNLSMTANLSYQRAQLDGDITYPNHDKTSKTFNSIQPFVMLDYKANSDNRLRVFFRTNSNAPSISQLQRVVNNSNPLFLSSGNPNLDQSYNTSLSIRYTYTNKNGNTFIAMIGANNQQNYIGDSTFVAQRDTTIGGIAMMKGGQFSKPVNMDGYWSANSILTYGTPLPFLKSNLNVNFIANYNRLPGIYNGQQQVTNNWTLTPGVVLSSNISDKLDFTLSYSAAYNSATNNLLAKANTSYLNQSGMFKFSWIFWKGFTFENSLTYSGYSGMSSNTYNQSFFLWNASIGKKFLKNNAGEIKLSVFDMLKQNKSINRNVTNLYFEDVIANTMPQYFMLTFTYQLRNIKGMFSGQGTRPQSSEERQMRMIHDTQRGRGMMGPGAGGPPPGPPPGGGPGMF